MHPLVVFDSAYGNTEAVARAIGGGLGEDVAVLPVGQLDASSLSGVDLLVMGSPTQGGRPTAAMSELISHLSDDALCGTTVATFDTRFDPATHSLGLRLVMKAVGYAAPRLAKRLRAKGGRMGAAPEGFIVEDKSGPLRNGEIERAAAWGRALKDIV